MRKLNVIFISLCAMMLISTSPVRAQNVLWVANFGLDANACSQTAPCATFQGAINKGNVAQINCLTSGSYGPFTITASITIDCGAGNIGNVVVSAGSAITLNTASAATIVLRHLSLTGLGMGTVLGISSQLFFSGTLIVEDCAIHGFHNLAGIQFIPSSGRGLLQVSNSQIFDNGFGIVVAPSNGQIASLTLNRVELVTNSTYGLWLANNLTGGIIAGTMRDSVVGATGQAGIYANASQVYFTVEQSSIVANLSFGIETGSAGAVLNVGGSTIGGNGTAIMATAGQIISFGNNQMSANGTNGSFTGTTPLR